MSKDIKVDFNTAKLAKEKFFCAGNRSIFTHYHKGYTYDGDKNHPESHKKNEIREDNSFYTINGHGNDSSNKHYTLYERPTQSSLQKWLREKHNIDVISYPSAHIKNKYIILIISKLELIYDESEIKYDSYEEALEKGLLEALKLI